MNGITFEQRIVRALDDARLYESLYEDGILRGCALTYAGAGVTIAPGALVVCGRQIAFDSAETFTASPTYSNGYGRLKLTIDLAQAPSDSSFTQGSIAWQYASTNSFAALVQEDVNNGTDTDYEIEICRVKFASGNVSEILTEIGSVGIIRGLFGLGLSLTTGDDLDNCKTPGALYATAGLSVSHAPASVAYKILVIQIAPGVIMQFALTAAAKIYMRVYAGSWTSWTSGIEAVTDLPTTYNEGDVYVKV